MQPSRSFATDRKPRTMIMPPGSLSGRNFQPSFHSGMEAAYVGHPANPFQNRPARSSGREIDVKAPVRRRCCMPQDVGIRPLDDVIHMQAVGRGSKGEFVDSDPIHLRIGAPRGRRERDKAECEHLPSTYLRESASEPTLARARDARHAFDAPGRA